MSAWESLLMGAGLIPGNCRRYSAWKSPLVSQLTLLTRKGNRKSPGFNPDERTQHMLSSWIHDCIDKTKPELILCMDVALLGLVEPRWDIATIDNLRGGVYDIGRRPFVVTVPISAIHNNKKPKDIKAMNEGYESQDEWEAAKGNNDDDVDDKDVYIEPYVIPYGRFVLSCDLKKVARILEAQSATQNKTRLHAR